MTNKSMIWIDWADLGRSRNLAGRFGVVYYPLNYLAASKLPGAFLLRYFLAALRTVVILVTRNPRVVFMTGSPPFPHFIVYFLSKLLHLRFVVDTHSGYFDDPKFQILPRLRAKIMKHALFHIVTNEFHKGVVEAGDGKAYVLGVLLEPPKQVESYRFPNAKSFVWVSRYSDDEPLEIVFDVASKLPDFSIYITGNPNRASMEFLKRCRSFENIVLTGFVSEETYTAYLKGAMAVIALTTRDNTMQRGAYEALSYLTPIVTSDWSILRQSFYKGAEFVNNTAPELGHALQRIAADPERHRREIRELHSEYEKTFNVKLAEIRETLDSQ